MYITHKQKKCNQMCDIPCILLLLIVRVHHACALHVSIFNIYKMSKWNQCERSCVRACMPAWESKLKIYFKRKLNYMLIHLGKSIDMVYMKFTPCKSQDVIFYGFDTKWYSVAYDPIWRCLNREIRIQIEFTLFALMSLNKTTTRSATFFFCVWMKRNHYLVFEFLFSVMR